MKKILMGFMLLIICIVGVYILQLRQPGSSPTHNVIPSTQQTFLKPGETFIVMGDTGTAAPQQKDVAKAIELYCKTQQCKAAIIAGDVIYENGVNSDSDPQFQTKFENMYKDLSFPFYIAFGNHDYLGCTQCYLDYAKKSEKWQMPSAYYKQSFDNIDFFIIDTEKFNLSQQNWLAQELEKSKAQWKAVVGHRPIVTYEELHAYDNWSGQEQLKNIICKQANLYLAGHSHLLEEVGKIDTCSFTQLIAGSGGSYPRKILPNHPKETFFYEGNGFLGLTIHKDTLKYQFIDKKGKLLHTGEIKE